MSHAPYIMPDGRPLTQFLQDTQAEQPRGTRKSKQSTRRNRRAERDGGWTHKNTSKTTTVSGDAEQNDESIKLGRDRRRRYLNERILREMAGALTASDMEALFQPVPFGQPRVGVFSEVMAPDMLPIWDLFRNIDEDKEARTLQKWEAYLRSQKQSRTQKPSEAVPQSGLLALKAWSKVPRKARDALKRSSVGAVEALEMPILEFLDQESKEDDEAELELELDDGYQRLLTHGLAVFHGLRATTTPHDGSMRLKRAAGLGTTTATGQGGSPPICCADIVFALAENPAGGLSAKLLDRQLRRTHLGSDADSDASFVLV